MQIVRTPDQRFAACDDAAALRYTELDAGDGSALRIAYRDEGPRDAPLVLMLHGEPTWSFLYRTVRRPVLDAGLRVVVPDLIGFGRSDKPASIADYTYQRHVDWMYRFASQLGADIHLVCQDWGGLIGLRLVAEHPARFASVVAMNTSLPTGRGEPPAAFLAWREHARTTPVLEVGRVVQSMCARSISPEVAAAYDAPFPDETYKAGARAFPLLVPVVPDDPGAAENRAAWKRLAAFERPFLTIFGDRDPYTIANQRVFQERVPGARGQPHALLEGVGHFLQEDAGDEVGARVADFVSAIARR